jgi:hypothetical protein
MKTGLERLRVIVAANLRYFISSSMIAAVILGIVAFALNRLNKTKHTFVHFAPQVNHEWVTLAIVIFFGTPIALYYLNSADRVTSGMVSKIEMESKTTKRYLFMASGIFWAALVSLSLAIVVSSGFMVFISTSVLLLSWLFIVKNLMRYVLSL